VRRLVSIVLGLVLILSFASPTRAAGTFVRHVIRTSVWTTPSPDPTGLDFLPSGQLLVADSEVDETPLNKGRNVWRITRSGHVERSMSTYKFSHEVTDVAVDGAKGLWYFSDDVLTGGRIFVVRLGPDKKYGTPDDKRRSFPTTPFGASDPEGLAWGGGSLWISDGTNGTIYRIQPGPNGMIEGGADDVITSRDLMGLGVRDLEGIEYAPNGHLFVLPNKRNADILEVEWAGGSLVKAYDLSLAHLVSPSAIAYGPSSANRAKRSFYIADRGLDNNSHPLENDGRIVELGVARRPLNLIRNASFEVDRNGDRRPDSWTFNSHFSRTSLAHHVGSYSGRHLGVGESSYTVRQDLADVVGGETYHFTGWTKIPTMDAFTYRVRILWFGGNGAQIGRSQLDVFTSSTTWHQTDHNVTAPPGTVRGKFVMSVTGLSGRIYVDGFSLTVVT
jgi:hypothetical protein